MNGRLITFKTIISAQLKSFFNSFNYATQEEIQTKKLQYDFRGLSKKFEKIVTTNNAIAFINAGEYTWIKIM